MVALLPCRLRRATLSYRVKGAAAASAPRGILRIACLALLHMVVHMVVHKVVHKVVHMVVHKVLTSTTCALCVPQHGHVADGG